MKFKTAIFLMLLFVIPHHQTLAAPPDLNFTVNMSEAVTVNTGGGTPRIAVDVGGQTRYASYASGSGSAALTFAYAPTIGDLDLDGIALSSPVDLNGGTITDLNGNPETDLTFTVPNTSGIKIDYPSLSMDFIYDADGRYTLNGIAYNDLTSFLGASGGTFSRASIGTYFDSSGTLQTASANQPRFDHDPVTHAPNGVLIEESRTNFLKRSSEFDNATWIKQANCTLTSNTTIAPDGTLTADTYSSNGVSPNGLYQTTATTANTTYTATIYVKYISGRWFRFMAYNGTSNQYRVWFDLQNGIMGTAQSNGTATFYNASMLNIGNGWYRISVTGSITTGTTYTQLNAQIGDGNTTTAVGDAYIWGAQLEQGAFPTSYIPTTAASVTREADNLNIPTASWYNQNAGSFFNDISWQSSTGSLYPTFFRVDGAGGNKWHAYYNQSGGNIAVDGFTNGVSQGAWGVASSTSGTAKISAAQELNNANAAFNGTIKTLDTIWSPPNVSQLNLYGSNANKWFGKIKYYPIRTSDAQLQLLTQ
ncbi:MAG: hypothetical protein IAE63_06075 [Alphaproteobacteria bacterium]|nr:hypothetical protein [Alphaproteobacteria bacterium]